MRIMKWIAIGFGALVALIVVGLILVVAFVDPNDYRDDIERIVEQQTGRDLKLSGDLKLSVFPWIALETGAASLGDAPGFGPEPFASIKEARVSVKFWPLLSGKVEAGNIRLVEPRIRLITDEQGRNNWDDLGSKEPQTQATEPAKPFEMPTLSGVEIVNATLVQENRQTNTRRMLTNFNLETGRIAPGDPFELDTYFAYQHAPDLQVLAQLAARVTADPAQQRYELGAPAIELKLKGAGYPEAGMPVTIKAERIQSNLNEGTHSVDEFGLSTRYVAADSKADGLPIELSADALAANTDAQTLKVTNLQLQAAGATVQGTLQGEEIIDAPHLTGTLELAETSLKSVLAQAGITLPEARDPKAYERLSFKGNVDVTRTSAAINDAVLKLDDTTARGSLGVADFEAMALRFDLNVDRINADRYRAPEPPEAEQKGEGKPAAEPVEPAPIPVELIRDLNMRGSLKVGEAIFAGVTFTRMELGVNARDGKMRLNPLAARMYDGQYQGDINVDATGDVARISMNERVEGVNFAPLFKDAFETTRVSGIGNATLKVTAAGRTTDALLKTLDGNVAFNVRDGALEGADLWYEIRRARALFKREAPPAASATPRTPFKTLQGSGTFNDGVLSNNDLEAALEYLRIKGAGTVDLPQDALDYRLTAIVLKMPMREPDAAQMEEMVDAEIPVRITGSLTDPKVRPDIEGYLKQEVKQRVDEERQKVEDKVRNKLQDKLKDILGGR